MTQLINQTISNIVHSSLLEEITVSMQRVMHNVDSGHYAYFDVVKDPDDLLNQLDDLVTSLKAQFKKFVILGTGGSSLGGQTLCALKSYPGYDSPVLFLDNVDPTTFDMFLDHADLSSTCFIVISKSGATAETLCQFLCIIEHFKKQGLESARFAKHFIIITENKASALRQLADNLNLKCLDHPTNIGGRFSVFSVVALLPAMLAGLDVRALLQGADDYLNQGLDNVVEGVTFQYQHFKSGHNISVMMPYLDQLKSFSAWYSQLWAESLGKDGQGSTPVAALGTVDQHSQLQLYRDGPQDKIFTFIYQPTKKLGLDIGPLTSTLPELGYMSGRTMGDLLEAELYATSTSLTHKGPVRLMELGACNESSLGALLTHFILETILMAEVLGVNAFDQPGVEESKILTRKFLSEKYV